MRTPLLILICLPVTALGDLRYTATLTPSHAALGAKIILAVKSSAGSTAGDGPSLNHESLTIELSRPGWSHEPRVAFPNRRTVAESNLFLREGNDAPPIDLASGEMRSRTFDLAQLFPLEILSEGEWQAAFTLRNGGREVRSELARVTIRATPDSVLLLFNHLETGDLAVRERCALLLHEMTGRGLDYDPSADPSARNASLDVWRKWWEQYRGHLGWEHGGVRFQVTRMAPSDRIALLRCLRVWRETNTTSDLKGTQVVADSVIAYPPEDSVFIAEPAVEASLGLCFRSIGESRSTQDADCLLLATAMRFDAAPETQEFSRLAREGRSRAVRLSAQAVKQWFEHRRDGTL